MTLFLPVVDISCIEQSNKNLPAGFTSASHDNIAKRMSCANSQLLKFIIQCHFQRKMFRDNISKALHCLWSSHPILIYFSRCLKNKLGCNWGLHGSSGNPLANAFFFNILRSRVLRNSCEFIMKCQNTTRLRSYRCKAVRNILVLFYVDVNVSLITNNSLL